MSALGIRRALLSVSDKTGIVEFGHALAARGVEILSTGGTARVLTDAGIAVTEVSDYTGVPEMMDGRVKTLHPRIHGGLLGRRGVDDQAMARADIPPIDLLAVNLYPFARTVARPGCTFAEAIENIDIGGPAMLRAAAKNHASVAVVVDPACYGEIIDAMDGGGLGESLRLELATTAFEHTASYDGMIANYLGAHQASGEPEPFPRTFSLQLGRLQPLRYGENPHQQAAFFGAPVAGTLAAATQLQGKPLSFNNLADADTAMACARAFSAPACVIVKHANPCGVAERQTLAAAYEEAFRADATSAFGGIIAFNRPLDLATAQLIMDRQFVEVIIAPSVELDALSALAAKPAIRVLAVGEPPALTKAPGIHGLDLRTVSGGLLVQEGDTGVVAADQLVVASHRAPSRQELQDLRFAWKVVRYVKSNAIVYGRDRMTVGIGAGQMSRVYSARIAALKAQDAGLSVKGSVMASDAFFPFRDGIDQAAEAGVTAVIQPGGSVRDDEVIAAANAHDIAMVFTGMRHFRH